MKNLNTQSHYRPSFDEKRLAEISLESDINAIRAGATVQVIRTEFREYETFIGLFGIVRKYSLDLTGQYIRILGVTK
jgi:hypothetical protein